jgi:hypothetical protein
MRHEDLLRVQAGAVTERTAPFAELRDARGDELLAKANVVGVGIGHKLKDGEDTGTDCLSVLVRYKRPESDLDSADLVPKTMDSRPTDVLAVGEVFAHGLDRQPVPPSGNVDPHALSGRVRPLRPGFSVGHPGVTAGTIGAGCYDLEPMPGRPRAYYLLSNNHVIANSNDATPGDPIVQPGPVDGGHAPQDVVGQLSRFIPIRFDGECNHVDAAVAQVPFHMIDRSIHWLGVPRSAAVPAEVGMLVRKTGRTTDFTTGRVTTIGATINVNFGNGRVAKFCEQIVTTDMSAGGDSGSLVLDLDNNPVGLLFAGSPTATILNPIATVQLALDVRLWP